MLTLVHALYIGTPAMAGAPSGATAMMPSGASWRAATRYEAVVIGRTIVPVDGSIGQASASTRARSGDAPLFDSAMPATNGFVSGTVRYGGSVYVSGNFSAVGESWGGLVSTDSTTGLPRRSFPRVAGSIYAITPDGAGGYYVGGDFSGIGGVPRSGIAKIRADGTVSEWDPGRIDYGEGGDLGLVQAIVVDSGRVYIGGGFYEVAGQRRINLACLDAETGALLDWDPETDLSGWVSALAVHGDQVYVGGAFSSIGAQSRSALASVDKRSGDVSTWNPPVGGWVMALLVHDDTLYVGGDFFGISGVWRQSLLAAFDITTGGLLPFDAHIAGIIQDYGPRPCILEMAMDGDRLWVTGNFTQVGDDSMASVAALNPATGAAVDWRPAALSNGMAGGVPPTCLALQVIGDRVYVAGDFATVGGTPRASVVALDTHSGAIEGWNPRPLGLVYALAQRGAEVLMGGEFNLVSNWYPRSGLAAVDAATGAVRDWAPDPDGYGVFAMVAHGGQLYVGGDFSWIGGQPRAGLAAVDTLSGAAGEWNPGGVDLNPAAMIMCGDTLYFGGYFTEVGGQARNQLAAIDANTGALTDWHPAVHGSVFALAARGSTLYVGGMLSQIGDEPRHTIAAFDRSTGTLLPWNPDGGLTWVSAIVVEGQTVYVGGAFAMMGGQPRAGLAAIDAESGLATDWDPNPTGKPTSGARVNGLALVDSVLYVGGDYSAIGGQARSYLAAVSTRTGLATDWDPRPDGIVWNLMTDGSSLYAGGGFARIEQYPASTWARFAIPQSPPTVPHALSFLITPNPVASVAIARFALPAGGPVGLELFDVQGRMVATLIRDSRPAGVYSQPIPSEDLRGGVYFCRLTASGTQRVRKMVVVR